MFSSYFFQNNWDSETIFEEITILRGQSGLGFSISGGTDNPHLEGDFEIYVTKITPGGAASVDGRLKIHDIIKKVNDTHICQVTHAIAVNILREAGSEVRIVSINIILLWYYFEQN